MNLIKKILLIFTFILVPNIAISAVPSECTGYTDCDMLVACSLYDQIERAASGQVPDYDGAVADAASYRQACSNYPDLFSQNIDVVINEQPQIRLTINWNSVRNRMRYGNQTGFESEDLRLVELIVSVLGPDTAAQQTFFTDLATQYVAANKRDQTARLDDAFVLDFLGDGDNVFKYKTALVDLTGSVVEAELGIDINWDDVLIEISNVLDQAMQKRGAILCENNSSWQTTIDVVGWAATVIAAVATFFTGGAGGAAVAAGRAAVGASLKAAAKGIAKVGGKAAAKRMSRTGGRMLAKSAIDLGMKANMRGYVNYAGKGVLKTGIKNYVKTLGANLTRKKTLLAGAGALIYQIGSNVEHSAGSTLYSLVDSDLSTDIINCQDVDHNEGCYTVCGDGRGSDDMNTKVFNPILGKSYCVNEADYALYEINPDGSRGDVLIMEKSQWDAVKNAINTSVKDTGNCDWNEDDIDIYAGFYMYDPDTLEISTDKAMAIDDAIRIDE